MKCLYAAYTSPFGGNDILTIVGAEKLASGGYSAWEILHEDHRDFAGTPLLDQARLLNDGIVSIYLQENTDVATRTGINLHVLEFSIISAVPEPGSFLAVSAFSLAMLTHQRRIA